MPKRTNAFQELVTLIQRALVPVGAKVTPSAMVPGKTSGALREIDVLVETETGPYSIKIAVEAKDEGRKLDATKIEAIIGKYRGSGAIQVNKVVVIARHGFTEEARTRAADEDIELMTLDEARTCRWPRMMPGTFQLKFPPLPFACEVSPPLPEEVLSLPWRKNGRFICTCHGNDYGSPDSLMGKFLHSRLLPDKEVVAKLHEIATTGSSGKAEAHYTLPLPRHVLRFEGTDYPVESMTMHFRYVDAKGPMKSAMYTMEDSKGQKTTVMHSEGTVGGHAIKMLMPMNKKDSRGILVLEAIPPTTTKGPTWKLKDGQWMKSPESECGSQDTDSADIPPT